MEYGQWLKEWFEREDELLEKIATGYVKYRIDVSISFVTNYFYNPQTEDTFSVKVRDYERPGSEDYNRIADIPIAKNSEEIIRHLGHQVGIIYEGDTVEVFKGRKVPIGTIAVVEKIVPWHDRYGRWQCDYAYLSNGMKTNIKNCRLVMEN